MAKNRTCQKNLYARQDGSLNLVIAMKVAIIGKGNVGRGFKLAQK